MTRPPFSPQCQHHNHCSSYYSYSYSFPFLQDQQLIPPYSTMLSPHSPRDGETPSPHRHPNPQNNNPLRVPSSHHHHHFQSTVSLQKLRRFNWLILVFRLASFCFSLAASIFTATNYSKSGSPNWYDFEAFRYVFAVNAIVSVYSLFEMGVSAWEISRNSTLFPETFQLWFDFGHDQVFAYVLMSAESTGTALARTLRGSEACVSAGAFCVQSDIAISMGFAGLLFLGLSSLLSGFRVACFIVSGSRFHL